MTTKPKLSEDDYNELYNELSNTARIAFEALYEGLKVTAKSQGLTAQDAQMLVFEAWREAAVD